MKKRYCQEAPAISIFAGHAWHAHGGPGRTSRDRNTVSELPDRLLHVAQPATQDCLTMAKPAQTPSSATEWDRDAALTAARILLEIKAVNFRPEEAYTFTSGWKSPVYIDCRRIIYFPRARGKSATWRWRRSTAMSDTR